LLALIFAWVLGILCPPVLLSALARPIRVAYPALLALGGAALALIPQAGRGDRPIELSAT
jgi:CPA1 family monovalent cation:H+ antiporter